MGCSLALRPGALCTVEAVQPASRAAGAGVREGDVLLTANGQAPPIESESGARSWTSSDAALPLRLASQGGPKTHDSATRRDGPAQRPPRPSLRTRRPPPPPPRLP